VLTRARKHLLVALILPLLVVKAMLPAGFMPTVSDGQLRIVMCSAGLAQAGSATADESLPGERAPNCAFAVAGLAAPPPPLLTMLVPLAPCHLPAPSNAAVTATAALRRYQSPRGPPSTLLPA
jgi:hypothetical protein